MDTYCKIYMVALLERKAEQWRSRLQLAYASRRPENEIGDLNRMLIDPESAVERWRSKL